MLPRPLFVCLIVIASGISTATLAQQPIGPTPASSATDADITRGAAALIDRYRELGWFNGSVLVARGDTWLYRGAAGHATLDHPARLTEDSPLRIVGISQLFTVALTLKMVEQSAIALDDPIGKVMTGWPDAYKPITVRQLLLGTSGVRDVTTIPEFVRTIAVPRTLYDLTQVILKDTPAAPPGTFGRAQNSDYHLLAAVLETAGGAPFDTLLDWNVAVGQLSNISAINGATASLQVTPSTGVVIIAWCNVASGEANAVAAALQSLVLGHPQPLPVKRTAVALSAEDVATMRGT